MAHSTPAHPPTEETTTNRAAQETAPSGLDLRSVAGLLAAFAPYGLLDHRTAAEPPRRPLTVLRRAARRLPAPVTEVLRDAGLDAATALPAVRREALAALLIDLAVVPRRPDTLGWAAGLERHVADALGVDIDAPESRELRAALLDELLVTLLVTALEPDDADEGAAPARLHELERMWLALIAEGLAAPTPRAAWWVNRHAWSLAAQPDLTAAAHVAATVARWAADPSFDNDDRVRYRVHAVYAAQRAGQHTVAVALAEEWQLVDATADEFGDCDHLVYLCLALGDAYRRLGQHEAATGLARRALWTAECAFGADAPQAIDALKLLGVVLLESGAPHDALVVASHAHALLAPQPATRPAELAQATVGFAICLHATGDHGAARAVVGEVVDDLARRLGPHDGTVETLRQLAA